MENKKRAVLYCRVSTKEQVEEGNSLVSQERNCREYAAKNNYEIAEVFIELGESAKTADRTELQKLFSFCANKKNNISVVISYKIDRISRNTDDYSQIRILLKRYGVEIKSTSEYFENTPAGRFMENIIANVAQFDNDVRTERSVGGMKQAVSEGRYIWMGPIGYSNGKINNKSTIFPNDKADGIHKTFILVANRTYTLEETRHHIVRYGIHQTSGLPLAKSHFHKLLRNKLYIGKILKFGQEFQGTFEPLISEVLFNQVQLVLRKRNTYRNYLLENPDFPLRRFLKSPNGKSITGCWCKGKYKKYPYYTLADFKKVYKRDFVENLFVEYLNSFSLDETFFESLKNAISEKFTKASIINKQSFADVLEQQKALKEKQQILVNKNLKGVISDSVLKEQLDTITTELWKLEDALINKEERMVNVGYVFSRLQQMLIKPGEYWKNQPFEIKLKLQKFNFPEGLIFDGSKFQTPKLSSVFKLSSLFLNEKFSIVPHQEPNNKHQNIANSPAPLDEVMFNLLKQVEKELIEYDGNEESTNPCDLKNLSIFSNAA